MAKLGTPNTPVFDYGPFEVRLSPLHAAARQDQSYSLGLIDTVTFSLTVNTTDLLGGAPQNVYDTAITGQQGTITASLREESRRNLGLRAGMGILGAATDFLSVLEKAGAVAGDFTNLTTEITISGVATKQLAAGDVLVVWKTGMPESVSVLRVASVTGDAGADQVVTLAVTSVPGGVATSNTGSYTYTAADIAAGLIQVAKSSPIALGNMDTVNYFSARLIKVERNTKRPKVVDIWKCTMASGIEIKAGGTEFGSSELSLKILPPSLSEISAGGQLEHIAPYYEAGRTSGMVTTFSDAAPSV